MTHEAVSGSIVVLLTENIFMSSDQLLATVFVIIISAILVYIAGYYSGRLYGYRQGLDKGEKQSGKVQHLKGMTDGYVMALQHTPAQRNEYMNNVLLKIGATTPATIEAERQRRFQMHMES
jgi:hypothetical protein